MSAEIEDDDSFQFEDDKFSDENKDIIYKGLLSGLYYLPPEHILKTQSGWGWPINYEQVKELHFDWRPLEKQVEDQDFEISCNSAETLENSLGDLSFLQSLQYAEIPLHQHGGATGAFRIYKATVNEHIQSKWGSHFQQTAVDDSKNRQNNISVSNAGGYHSKQTLFQTAVASGDMIALDFCSSLSAAVRAIELHDHRRSQELQKKYRRCSQSVLREFSPPADAEAWLNLSRHGSWNRLHTHEGACWSGCYYVKVPKKENMSRPYSGHLLMKPTAHRRERKVSLSKVELSRLNLDEGDDSWYSVQSCAEYLSIPPEEGNIVFFPSYVHHAVVPLSVQREIRGCPEGDRISLAFNYNEAIYTSYLSE